MTTALFTIGHSNQSQEDFLKLLHQHKIQVLVDIRRFPGSRSFPQFNRDSLTRTLQQHEIGYQWMEDLGGRRSSIKSADPELNSGLRNRSFRNYADYMQTDEFRQAVRELLETAAQQRTAIMCSESVFWRCHRRLVSDYVTALGVTVHHIFPAGDLRPHAVTDGARINDGQLSYPGSPSLF